MSELRVTDEQVARALEGPTEPSDSYGTFSCGCSWDSGPFDMPCRLHDTERLSEELLLDAVDALGVEHPVAVRIRRLMA